MKLLSTMIFLTTSVFFVVVTIPLSSYATETQNPSYDYTQGTGNPITDSKQPRYCNYTVNGNPRKTRCSEMSSTAPNVTYNVCIYSDNSPTNAGWHQGNWDGRKSGNARFTSKRACTEGVDVYVKDGGMDMRIGPMLSKAKRTIGVNHNKWTVDAAGGAQVAFDKKQSELPAETLYPHFCFKNESKGIPFTSVECTAYLPGIKGFCYPMTFTDATTPSKGVVGQWWVVTTNANGAIAVCKGGVDLIPASENTNNNFKAWGDTTYSIVNDGGQPPKTCFYSDTESMRCSQSNCRIKDGDREKGGLQAAADCTDAYSDLCEAQACSGCRYDYVQVATRCRCDKISTTPNFKTGCCWDGTFSGQPGYWVRYLVGGGTRTCAKGLMVEPLDD